MEKIGRLDTSAFAVTYNLKQAILIRAGPVGTAPLLFGKPCLENIVS